MNKALFQKVLPHLVAFAIFLIIAVIYCKPALNGMVLQQSDVIQFQGAIRDAEDYRAKHGDYPLWTNNLFSGMPTFQIGGHGNNFVAGYTHLILTLGLVKPIGFFWLACISFYFLCMVLRLTPWLGILGSLAFAYATYDPVIISVGHDTKMWSIAYMPAVLGSVILIYEKRYLIGAALTALTTSLMVSQNHVQIVYYLFLAILVMSIFYAVRWIKTKDFKHLLLGAGLALAGIATGILSNAEGLMSSWEYQKYTIRGGPSELKDTTRTTNKVQTGLDKDYAFSYSLAIPEPLVMMVPRMYGGSSDHMEVKEKSKAVEAFRMMPQQLQQDLQRNLEFYWGGLANAGQVGSSGPPYAGAIICFLAILAMFVLDSKHKWWLFTASVLAVVMSWGSFFIEFNTIFYDYFPFFNKFRAPSMILVIPQLCLPILAVLGLDAIIKNPDRKLLMSQLKKGLIATAAIFVLLFIIYASFDFVTKDEKSLLQRVAQQNAPAEILQAVRGFYEGLKDDREGLFMGDIWRSLGFIIVGIALVFLMIRKTISPVIGIAGITLFVMIDLMVINTTYLNHDSYQEPNENSFVFQKSKADEEILKDTSFFRVFNFGGNAFAENFTPYYFNSVGGYHAAKLRIYQDLIERQFTQQPNIYVLNMLNTKYFIKKDNRYVTEGYQPNPGALGNAWFVNNIHFVKTADEEMKALDSFDAKQTAFVREEWGKGLKTSYTNDSTDFIRLVHNDNDIINYTSQAKTDQFAVFSEIYYPAGWKAFIDNREVPIIRVNYVLRGISVPAGNHAIQFRFEPQGYLTGKTLTNIFSWLMLAALLAAVFLGWRQTQNTKLPPAKTTAKAA
jgi:hypothetical protein